MIFAADITSLSSDDKRMLTWSVLYRADTAVCNKMRQYLSGNGSPVYLARSHLSTVCANVLDDDVLNEVSAAWPRKAAAVPLNMRDVGVAT